MTKQNLEIERQRRLRAVRRLESGLVRLARWGTSALSKLRVEKLWTNDKWKMTAHSDKQEY